VPNPVEVVDLEHRFRSLTEAETITATALLVDAWAELTAPTRVPDLEQRMADGLVSEALARRVVTAMVLRVLRNPEAIARWAVDDASFTRDSAIASGLLYATDDEVALLSGVPAGAGQITYSAKYSTGWRS
jgi:hypothetical protein